VCIHIHIYVYIYIVYTFKQNIKIRPGVLVGRPQGKRPLGIPRIDERIILK
jgi:hypothetical protein